MRAVSHVLAVILHRRRDSPSAVFASVLKCLKKSKLNSKWRGILHSRSVWFAVWHAWGSLRNNVVKKYFKVILCHLLCTPLSRTSLTITRNFSSIVWTTAAKRRKCCVSPIQLQPASEQTELDQLQKHFEQLFKKRADEFQLK